MIALDHQSAFSHGDFSALPFALARHARAIGRFVRAYTPEPDLQISSSFYAPTAKEPRFARTPAHFIGVLLRDAVRYANPIRGNYLVAYLRPGTSASTIRALEESPCEVRLYGLKDVRPRGAVVPRPISEAGFVDDLAGCRAVISTAGNQLLGEAIHLGKPVLALPEPGNKEQEINGWFLERSGAGRSLPCDLFTASTLRSFLAAQRQYIQAGLGIDVDGTGRALELIEGLIRSRASGRSARTVPMGANEAAAATATA